ncbi:unnamed protein product [Coffea canephora]|uniref:Zinc finger PHD-type domain-containing protein n=1 Tax=Coffea canephora TaxID=49390 RepID=A0A068UAM2_COFCA|nr:unnamed protein product [Coffea canephora]
MANNIFEACKRMRRKNPKIPFPFDSFPIMGSFKNLNYGPFRENIRLFLQEFAEKFEDNAVPGWGHHFVSKRKYHLIIPEVDYWKKPLKDNFLDVRTHILYGLIHCNGYGHLICINGVKAPSNFLSETDAMNLWDRICSTLCTRKVSVRDEINLRLLYVVGYGQSWYGKWGYKFSHGTFGVRKGKYESAVEYLRSLNLDKIISDFKNKSRGGRIKQIINKYRGVVDIPLITLSDLLKFMLGFGGRARVQGKTENKVVKSSCQHVLKRRDNEEPTSFDALVTSIANSCRWPARRVEHVLKQIVNLLKQNKGGCDGNYGVSRYEMREELRKCVGDTGLIDFVLKSVNCFAIGNYVVRRSLNSSTRRFEFSIQEVLEEAEPDCQWPEERVEHASEVTANILTENSDEENTMPWRELQDKARECLGETQPIDCVVHSMDNPMIRNQSISRTRKPSTNKFELPIQGLIKDAQNDTMECSVAEDALYLYRSVLFGYRDTHPLSLATKAIMDSKYFVKEWCFKEHNLDPLIALSCLFLPSFDELETELMRPLSPAVVVAVPLSSTIGELKVVAQAAFRDTYCIMDKFVASQIGGLKKIDENKVVCHSIEPSSPVWVRGSGLDLGTTLRYEDGAQRLTVDCCCGAKYDDGERLATCEVCNVSQHTRCSGIAEKEGALSDFLCSDCVAVSRRK